MTIDRSDEQIRRAFQAQRQDLERSSVPEFDSMLARARAEAAKVPELEVVQGGASDEATSAGSPRDPRWRMATVGGWVSVAAAAAAVALLFVSPGTSEADREFEALVRAYTNDVAAGALRSPTTSLLDIPGLDLGAVPSVGSSLRGVVPAGRGGSAGPDGRQS